MFYFHAIFLYFILVIHFQQSSSYDLDYRNWVSLPEFDYLMYSQRWPISACVEWESKNKSNTCNLPNDLNSWIVHGLWPTKAGSEGPNNCQSAIHFDPQQLQPIEGDLNVHWTNVESGTKPYSFWRHEWTKHGTCASVLPQLNSVYNYFVKGLQFNQQYNLTEILSKSNILPGQGNYNLDEIIKSINSVTGSNPQIECIVDPKTKDSLISEIRICFDKSLQITNCNLTQVQLTNCNLKKPIKYLKELPGDVSEAKVDEYYVGSIEELKKENEKLFSWYKTVNFLMWFFL